MFPIFENIIHNVYKEGEQNIEQSPQETVPL